MKTHADDYSCLRLKETQAQAAMQAWHCARPSSVDSAWCKRDQILKKLRVLSLVRRPPPLFARQRSCRAGCHRSPVDPVSSYQLLSPGGSL